MLSIDPQRTLALLIGTSTYPRDEENFPKLNQVEKNLKSLRDILCDKKIIGLPSGNIKEALNVDSASTLHEIVLEFTRKSADAIILYYAGHGTLDEASNELLLAVAGTTHELRSANAMKFNDMRQAIQSASAAKKILIIDSCFSGRSADYMGPISDLVQTSAADLEGAYVLAAVPSNALAKANGRDGHTVFTGELEYILRNGIPTNEQALKLDSVYSEVKARLPEGHPSPVRGSFRDAGEWYVARNLGVIEPTPPLPEERTPPVPLGPVADFEPRGSAIGLSTLAAFAAVLFFDVFQDGTLEGVTVLAGMLVLLLSVFLP